MYWFFQHFITELQENIELERLRKIYLLTKKVKLFNSAKSKTYQVKIIFCYLNEHKITMSIF